MDWSLKCGKRWLTRPSGGMLLASSCSLIIAWKESSPHRGRFQRAALRPVWVFVRVAIRVQLNLTSTSDGESEGHCRMDRAKREWLAVEAFHPRGVATVNNVFWFNLLGLNKHEEGTGSRHPELDTEYRYGYREVATMSGLSIPRTHEVSISCKCQELWYALMNDGYLPCLFFSSFLHCIIEWAPPRA